jgi:hypothetical protein
MRLRWRKDSEFDEEIQAHLDLETQANLDRGMAVRGGGVCGGAADEGTRDSNGPGRDRRGGAEGRAG